CGGGGDAQRLPAAVLPAVQEEPHAAAVPPGDPHPGPGAQPDGGRGRHRALRSALHAGCAGAGVRPALPVRRHPGHQDGASVPHGHLPREPRRAHRQRWPRHALGAQGPHGAPGHQPG
ncbi:LOW QUALITY PROTEIN: hypothetical protein CRUP_007131, partial [Coryphaenoides rupestris]